MDSNPSKTAASKLLDVGYHMTGLPLHDELSAINKLSAIGYQTIALVPRRTSLHPDHPAFDMLADSIRQQLLDLNMRPIVSLDGSFVAKADCRDWPSLVSRDVNEADLSEQLTARWIEIAARLGSNLITFSSGALDSKASTEPHDDGRWDRLGERINRLMDVANDHDLSIALRLKPGHAVSTTAQYETLLQWIHATGRLHLAADVHAMIQGGEFPMADRLVRHLDAIRCVFIESSHLTDQSGGSSFAFDPQRLFQSLIDAGFREPVVIQTVRDPASPDGMPGLGNAAWAWNSIGVSLEGG